MVFNFQITAETNMWHSAYIIRGLLHSLSFLCM